jgi:hypothetical protein
MLYVNAQRNVSLVDPLLVRSLEPPDTVCFICMLYPSNLVINHNVAHRSWLLTTKQ